MNFPASFVDVIGDTLITLTAKVDEIPARLTKREDIAMHCLQGMLAATPLDNSETLIWASTALPGYAVVMADTLLQRLADTDAIKPISDKSITV